MYGTDAEADSVEEQSDDVAAPPTFAPLEEIAEQPAAEKLTILPVLVAPVAVLGAAALVGLVAYWVGDNLFDLLFLSAIGAGIGTGFLVGLALRLVGTRHQTFVAWCGIVAAILTMLARYTWDAYSVRPFMVDSGVGYYTRAYPDLSRQEVRARVEKTLSPWKTLRWFMRVQSREGISLGRARAGVTAEKPLVLTGGFFWTLIALETAAMGFAGGVAAVGITQQKYCAGCGKPLKENLLFRRHSDQTDDVLAHARSQDWRGLMSVPKAERTDPKNMADVLLYRCEAGGCPATLSVEKQTDGVPRKKVLHARISPLSAEAARAASLAEPI